MVDLFTNTFTFALDLEFWQNALMGEAVGHKTATD